MKLQSRTVEYQEMLDEQSLWSTESLLVQRHLYKECWVLWAINEQHALK